MRGSGIAGQVDLTGPPVMGDHNRHTSIANTEITDITYSDGGGRSDTGSDGGGFPSTGDGLPVLPTISDDHFADRDLWSPLRIPDEENYGSSPGSPGRGDLRLAPSNEIQPSMSGFQMQVEELE